MLIWLFFLVSFGSGLFITPYESIVLDFLLLTQQVILVLLVLDLFLLLLSFFSELQLCVDEARLLFW